MLSLLNGTHEIISFYLSLLIKRRLLGNLCLQKRMHTICASFAGLESFDFNTKFTCHSVLLSEIMEINMGFVLDAGGLPEF